MKELDRIGLGVGSFMMMFIAVHIIFVSNFFVLNPVGLLVFTFSILIFIYFMLRNKAELLGEEGTKHHKS